MLSKWWDFRKEQCSDTSFYETNLWTKEVLDTYII